jgi:hypothetical protein
MIDILVKRVDDIGSKGYITRLRVFLLEPRIHLG